LARAAASKRARARRLVVARQQLRLPERRQVGLRELARRRLQGAFGGLGPTRALLDPGDQQVRLQVIRQLGQQPPRHGPRPPEPVLLRGRPRERGAGGPVQRVERQRPLEPSDGGTQVRLHQRQPAELVVGVQRIGVRLREVTVDAFRLGQPAELLEQAAEGDPGPAVPVVELQDLVPVPVGALEVALFLGRPRERHAPRGLARVRRDQASDDRLRRREAMLRHQHRRELVQQLRRRSGRRQRRVVPARGLGVGFPLGREPRCLQQQHPRPGRSLQRFGQHGFGVHEPVPEPHDAQ
jgi:hypothetical protein